MSPAIREARDDDGVALIALVAGCYDEYEGCILDVDGESPELHAIASDYEEQDGRFWVAEDGAGRIIGSVGVEPALEAGGVLLRYLYVDRSVRRSGLASRLVALVEREARARGAAFVTLWTDTRFTAAHGLYERLGYERQPGTRALDDLSRSVEYRYVKMLGAG